MVLLYIYIYIIDELSFKLLPKVKILKYLTYENKGTCRING